MADLIKEQLKTGFTKVENNSFFFSSFSSNFIFEPR